ncbi:MAG: hypothetical protein ACLGSA_13220 [Acidobacteriota bacterium]
MLDPGALLPGDVLLYRGETCIAKAIRCFDNTKVNHAGLYLGGGLVGEALADGVKAHPLDESIADKKVWVYRHIDRPTDVTPVIRQAELVLAEGNAYGYEQILLLAMLAISRRIALPGPASVFLRGVLDRSVALLVGYRSQSRQPMICSEFVYRCYDQALPEARDVFCVEIMGRTYSTGLSSSRWSSIHPLSLLTLFSPSSPLNAFLPRSPKDLDNRPDDVTDAGVEDMAREYLKQLELPLIDEDPKGTELESIRTSLFRFASVLHLALTGDPLEPGLGMRALGADSPKFKALLGVEADFVTPGDLLKSPSFYEVGQLA